MQRGFCPLLLAPGIEGQPYAADDRNAWSLWFKSGNTRIVFEARAYISTLGATRSWPNRSKVTSWRWDDKVSEAHFFNITGGGSKVFLLIAGVDCGYEVTDTLGEEHLDGLVGQMRFVEGTTVKR